MKSPFGRKWPGRCAAMALPAIVLAAALPAAADDYNIVLGSVSSSSGVYPFAVALATVITEADNGINVTTSEGGGGIDHARLMRRGVIHFSVSGSPAVVHAVATGTGGFKDDGPWDAARLMFMRNVNVTRIYVRKDAAAAEGIRQWADLAGRTISPGVPGTRDMERIMAANEVLGTGIEMLPAALDDATSRLAEGRLSAVVKGSPDDRFDAAMLALDFNTPLTVIGFSAEEAAALTARDPLDTFIVTPAGGIRELPDVGPINEMSTAVMVFSSSGLTQEVGHAIAVAVSAGWDRIGESYPPAAHLDPVADVIAQIPEIDGLYLHAGVVQYALENGIDVPARLIPPEYMARN